MFTKLFLFVEICQTWGIEDEGLTHLIPVLPAMCTVSNSCVSLYWNHTSEVYSMIGRTYVSNTVVGRVGWYRPTTSYLQYDLSTYATFLNVSSSCICFFKTYNVFCRDNCVNIFIFSCRYLMNSIGQRWAYFHWSLYIFHTFQSLIWQNIQYSLSISNTPTCPFHLTLHLTFLYILHARFKQFCQLFSIYGWRVCVHICVWCGLNQSTWLSMHMGQGTAQISYGGGAGDDNIHCTTISGNIQL